LDIKQVLGFYERLVDVLQERKHDQATTNEIIKILGSVSLEKTKGFFASMENVLRFCDLLQKLVSIICEDFGKENASSLQTAFKREIKKLGLIKVYQVECIRKCIVYSLEVNEYREDDKLEQFCLNVFKTLQKSNFMNNLIKYVFEYELNSMLHNEFLLIFKILIESGHAKHAVNFDILYERMMSSFKTDFVFSSGRKTNSGYFIIVTRIFDIIFTLENKHLSLILDINKLEQAYTQFLPYYTTKLRQPQLFKNYNDVHIVNEVTSKKTGQPKLVYIATIVLIISFLIVIFIFIKIRKFY